MKQFNSKNLIEVLIALLELQIFAVEAKRKCPASAAQKYLSTGAIIRRGICSNLYHTPCCLTKKDEIEDILQHGVVYAPSNTGGSAAYPVNPPVGWETTRCAIYRDSDAYAMWGDHPYADNRRQLIAEMIWQVRVELQARGYKL